MEKFKGSIKVSEKGWVVVPLNELGFLEDKAIPLSEFDIDFCEFALRSNNFYLNIEFDIHEIGGVSFAKIVHPENVLEMMSFSLQDMLDIAKFGFDYSLLSQHSGVVPEGNIKQHLFAKFGIV